MKSGSAVIDRKKKRRSDVRGYRRIRFLSATKHAVSLLIWHVFSNIRWGSINSRERKREITTATQGDLHFLSFYFIIYFFYFFIFYNRKNLDFRCRQVRHKGWTGKGRGGSCRGTGWLPFRTGMPCIPCGLFYNFVCCFVCILIKLCIFSTFVIIYFFKGGVQWISSRCMYIGLRTCPKNCSYW